MIPPARSHPVHPRLRCGRYRWKAREGRDVAAPFVVIRHRRAVILDAGFRIGVVDRDQPIGLRKRERPEKDGIDHREDGEVRPETDRDRGHRRDRERRSFAELAKSKAEVVHEQTYSARKAATGSASRATLSMVTIMPGNVVTDPRASSAIGRSLDGGRSIVDAERTVLGKERRRLLKILAAPRLGIPFANFSNSTRSFMCGSISLKGSDLKRCTARSNS